MSESLGASFRPTTGEHFYLQLLQAIAQWPKKWVHRLPSGERLIYAGPGEIRGTHRVCLFTADSANPIIAESQYSGELFSQDTPEEIEGIILRDLRGEVEELKRERAIRSKSR